LTNFPELLTLGLTGRIVATQLEVKLLAFRNRTFRLNPEERLTSVEDAIEFIEERGFITLWPIKGIDLPSLWTAVAGDRPVADEHDDPGHITWGWKDEMLSKRRWYYGKLLRGKATFVSLSLLPHFYALSNRLAELDDYRIAYEDGNLSREARVVADVLLTHGAQNTVQLRRLSNLSSTNSKSRFDKALVDLQRGLWVVPIGVARAGAWRYAFTYELFDRWFPKIFNKARTITEFDARLCLTKTYLESVGAATGQAIRKLLGWEKDDLDPVLKDLALRNEAFQLEDQRWVTAALEAENPC
jgi:hypothetical protein